MTDRVLSTQQLAVISALSSGATTTAAADQAGIHRNTIANWRRNYLPFQHALAHCQYDRAMFYREKVEDLVDLAIQTLQQILTDPKTPAGVRLKAALAVIATASTPPLPKKQIVLEIEKIQLEPDAPVHNSAQPPSPQPVHNSAQPDPEPPVYNSAQAPDAHPVHNSAQQPIRRSETKVGRNDPCPCGSSLKFKRCCIDKHTHQLANAA